MKCIYSRDDRLPEYNEECRRAATRILTFHNGRKAYVCGEHAKLGMSIIGNLIINNEEVIK
jgi:hypothetical protein